MSVDIRIALIGDYRSTVVAHDAIPKAIEIGCAHLGCSAEIEWIGTERLLEDVAEQLAGFDGIWTVPASPYASMEGALAGIRYAREEGVPFLGTCGGYQHAVLEYARNVLGYPEAGNVEVDPDTPLRLIAPLSCGLIEQQGEIRLNPSSRIAAAYGADRIMEEYRCSYGFNRAYVPMFEGSELLITGMDAEGEPRAVELENHPFFIGTAFQPERSALRFERHPLIEVYLGTALRRR